MTDQPWAVPGTAVAESFGVDPSVGRNDGQIAALLAQFGANVLSEGERRSALEIFVAQLRSIIVALLAAAAVISVVAGDIIDSIAVLVVIVINTAIGFVTELRARDSMEALRRLGSVETTVRRSGVLHRIEAEHLVPGDVVLVEGGDIVTADIRLLDTSRLQVDESALTGESLPITKSLEELAADCELADRTNMVYKGTSIVGGSGLGIVVTTGMGTELGHISSLVAGASSRETPLQRDLDSLGRRLVLITLFITAAIAITGLLAGRSTLETINTSVALAVAAVPEGLPIVATLALANGMRRMAQHNALIENLLAVETLGSVDLILTDKTGTLTENRMVLSTLSVGDGEIDLSGGFGVEGEFARDGVRFEPTDHPGLQLALRIGTLCGNSSISVDGDELETVGDPVEVALLMAAAKAGLHKSELLQEFPEVGREAFNADLKLMATYHQGADALWVGVKGGPGAVLEASTHELGPDGPRVLNDTTRTEWLRRNRALAGDGLRVLALATKTVATVDDPPYGGLTVVAMCGFVDPPRTDVRQAISDCAGAGVRIVMLTGDQPATAQHVGEAVGLNLGENVEPLRGSEMKSPDVDSSARDARIRSATIIARVTPQQKLDVLAVHQAAGSIVAMIGDGVNDAPALKTADIGVAMGQRGTQVARQAADMVLLDDQLHTIAVAIREGRVIFGNIRAFVLYLLSCNLSEILVVAIAIALNLPLPLLPLQILYLNIVTDVFPALALGTGRGGQNLMSQRPRDHTEHVLTNQHWLRLGTYGLIITAAVLSGLLLAEHRLNLSAEAIVTTSFLTLAFAQLWHVFNMADDDSGVFRNEVTRNRWVWGALVLCVGLLLFAVYVPFMADVLDIAEPSPAQWVTIGALSLIPLVLGRLFAVARSLIR